MRILLSPTALTVRHANRRHWVGAALWAALAACAGTALCQPKDYPAAKPVRLIVVFTAGGTTDILARAVGQKLGERFNQSFLIDNKPGGAGNIGTELAARAAPDGYTLVVNSVGPMAVNPTLFKKLNIDPLTDLTPVVQIANVPNVLVVPASLPVYTFDEFVAYARANPGRLNYGSTGVGTSSHLSSFMLGKRMGVEVTHVPYKGADALSDLLAARVQFMFATIPSVIQHIHSGKLRALAVSSAMPSRALPGIPTVAQKGFPGFEAGSWFGLFAPKGTPQDVMTLLNRSVNEALPSLEAQLVREGADPVGGTPEQFGRFVRDEYLKWKAIVLESGAVAE